MKKLMLLMPLMLLMLCGMVVGCTSSTPLKITDDLPDSPAPATIPQHVMDAIKPKPILFQRGIHPMVRYDYYESHRRAFECRNDPYDCEECPVGKPDRIIDLDHGEYVDVPDVINLWFACDNINMLIPEPGPGVFSDEFVCRRSPGDGSVRYRGRIFSCRGAEDGGHTIKLGDLQPGESRTIQIEVKP